ncbi:MAG: hypothetical protein M3228_09210 [Actinomycetota bacterium]|nr:hypothetical protein [Actinomycetota bacterium]
MRPPLQARIATTAARDGTRHPMHRSCAVAGRSQLLPNSDQTWDSVE